MYKNTLNIKMLYFKLADAPALLLNSNSKLITTQKMNWAFAINFFIISKMNFWRECESQMLIISVHSEMHKLLSQLGKFPFTQMEIDQYILSVQTINAKSLIGASVQKVT